MLQQQEALQPLLQRAAGDGLLQWIRYGSASFTQHQLLQRARQKALPDRMLLADQVQQAQARVRVP